jgi:hypothetical protein
MYDSCRTPRVAVLAAEAPSVPLLGRPTSMSCLTWQSAAAGLDACISAPVPGSGLHMLGQPREQESQVGCEEKKVRISLSKSCHFPRPSSRKSLGGISHLHICSMRIVKWPPTMASDYYYIA